ncbi:hypothetical protein [Actinoallomurus rhizosphaericola]|uniref:hypothetical protein n=1 Tax=Actinoallomurus rhizosphaericola TaxID=2952536 RepID=UPI0020935895|nr:hypothetical protein [Actinoallomurus rhizosphaericola]MCO5998822.1 hypothetical protein [Actinoallomurus rhizosphaericola]
MRHRRVAPAVLAILLLAACQDGHDDGDAGGDTAVPAVSADASAQVLAAYVRHYNRAVTAGDVKEWREVGTDAIGATAEAALRLGGGRPPRTGAISLRNPVMYVPRLRGTPRWFAVSALERKGGTERPLFAVFVQKNAKSAWRLSSRVYFHGDPPRIATDEQGYAVAVDPGAGTPATTPSALPAAHAAYLDRGNDGSIVPGDTARAWRTAEARQERQLRDHGVTVSGRSAPTGYPVYALRTDDGGAIVSYSLRRTTTYTATGSGDVAVLPADVRTYLHGRSAHRVTATWVWRAVTYLPVRGRATVLIEAFDLASAQAS